MVGGCVPRGPGEDNCLFPGGGGAHWISEQDGHLSRAFCCKMTEAAQPFQHLGKGGRGMKAESSPHQSQRLPCVSRAAGCRGVTFPFSPPASHRGETDLLSAMISSTHPVNLQDGHC